MSRDHSLYLDDVLDSCRRIRSYTEGMSRTEFEGDGRTIDAVAWNLVVIGEAVKQLPEELTSTAPEIEWRKIAGLRDVLVHAYFGLDTDIVWDVVENKIDPLSRVVESLRG